MSCENSCPGTLKKPQDIFILVCNTLPTKTLDHRSLEEYVDVLLKSGCPRDLAERVAFSRDSLYGTSIGDVFASAFSSAKRLYGFTSTSPVGKFSGPMLKKVLMSTLAQTFYSSGPDTVKLAHAQLSAASFFVSFEVIETKKPLADIQAQWSADGEIK